ncbi:MAG: ankyrin repeat domain-containing protein [Trueperaceae bacterium]
MALSTSRSTLRLTPEQEAIVEHEPTSTLVVPAFAGTGKTSTLVEHAKRWDSNRSLYLAFNSAIRTEARAKFPKHVKVHTMHSFVFRLMRVFDYEDRLEKGSIRRSQLQEAARAALGAEGAHIPAAVLRSISWAFKRYLISDDPAFSVQHMHAPKVEGWDIDRVMRTATPVVEYLMDFRSTGGPFTHDMYLKAFAVEQQASQNTQAPFSHILIDESQDLNPVMIGIATRFQVPLIIVGDTYQSIYAFRGAVSAMETFAGPRLPLTQSWRFGSQAATAANKILSFTSSPPPNLIRPNPKASTALHSGIADDGMILARTNARLMEFLMAGVNRPFFIAGGFTNFRREIEAAIDLWVGKPPRYNSPLPYRDREELEVEAREGGDPVATRLVKLLEEHGPVVLANTLERIEGLARDHANEADLHLSTAHRSKGLESAVVTLLDDFWSLDRRLSYRDYLKSKNEWTLSDERDFDQELNLLYVAATRAKEQLYLPPELHGELCSEESSRIFCDPPPHATDYLERRPDERVYELFRDNPSSAVKWDRESISTMISRGADLEARDSSGMTAMMWAAERGDTDLVNDLLSAGAVVDACTPIQQLFIAVVTRDVEWLKSLISTGVEIDGMQARYGPGRYSLLSHAAWSGDLDVVKVLIARVRELETMDRRKGRLRSFVNGYGGDYVTVLHDALGSGNSAVVEALLDAGAVAEHEVPGGAAGNSLLGFAAEYPTDVLVRRLFAVGADANIEGPDSKYAPLLQAVRCNRPLNVVALVEGGADLENRGEYGRSPLMYAAELGFLEPLTALIDMGAHLDARDDQGLTALMLAADQGLMECIEVLLDAGANARARSLEGDTAFDFAAQHEHLVGTDLYWRLNDARFS